MTWLSLVLLGAAVAVALLIGLAIAAVMFALPRPRNLGHFGLRRDR